MKENREQPIIMPATALNRADEESAMSEIGSLHDLGKFKTVQALKDAYDSLQVEFTKKCQKLSQLQKDKTENLSKEKEEKRVSNMDIDKNEKTEIFDNLTKNIEKIAENDEKTANYDEIIVENQEKDLQANEGLKENQTENVEKKTADNDEESAVENDESAVEILSDNENLSNENISNSEVLSGSENTSFDDEKMKKFLESNFDAGSYADEIKERFKGVTNKNSDPFAVAWAEVLLKHIKEGDKLSDPIINQYVLSDENVKKKIVEDYLIGLNNSKPPLVISSQSGERLSSVEPDNPKTLADAKRLVDKMFS